jgi:hypothetical protein
MPTRGASFGNTVRLSIVDILKREIYSRIYLQVTTLLFLAWNGTLAGSWRCLF